MKGETEDRKTGSVVKSQGAGPGFLPSSVCCHVCCQCHSAVTVVLLWQPLVKNCVDGTERVADSGGA